MATTILLWAVAVGLFYSITYNIMKKRKQTQEDQEPQDTPTDIEDNTDKALQKTEHSKSADSNSSIEIPNFIFSVTKQKLENPRDQDPSITPTEASTVTGKIYQALETISILQKTKKWETFTSRLDFLFKLSLSINELCISDQDKEAAIRQYLETYKRGVLSMRQKDFLDNPVLESNDGFLAKLKARFFTSFCEDIMIEIDSLKTDAAKQKRLEHIKFVALSIIDDLEKSNHIGLSELVKQEAEQRGVTLI